MSINIIMASLGMWHLQSTPSSLVLLDFPGNTAKSYGETLPSHWPSWIMFVVKYKLLQDSFCGQRAVRMQLKLMQQFNSVTESEQNNSRPGGSSLKRQAGYFLVWLADNATTFLLTKLTKTSSSARWPLSFDPFSYTTTRLCLEETLWRTFVSLFRVKTDRTLDVKRHFLEFVLIDCQAVTVELRDVAALSSLLSTYLHRNVVLKNESRRVNV